MKNGLKTISSTFCTLCVFLLFFLSAGIRAQVNFVVNGKVTDISGGPLIGVNVFEKGTSNGTITNVDGRFSLNVSSNSTLTFSYIGYKTQEIIVGTQQTISVTLTEDSEQLEEVVVVGYGVQKRIYITLKPQILKIQLATGM